VSEVSDAERERMRRERVETRAAVLAQAEQLKTLEARAWLQGAGLIVPGDGVGEGLARLDRYRRSILQASAPAYRPTVRQLQAAPLAGIDVEIEF
jgi:hypothetical protein